MSEILIRIDRRPAADRHGRPDRRTGILLSVVIPAHNEARNLPHLLDEIRTALSASDSYEVVVVDDGSSDDTLSVPEIGQFFTAAYRQAHFSVAGKAPAHDWC